MSRGELASFYDVFVDWPGRLGREMPGLLRRLRAEGARRILDAGCGTGRHVAALREEGFLAYGADAYIGDGGSFVYDYVVYGGDCVYSSHKKTAMKE